MTSVYRTEMTGLYTGHSETTRHSYHDLVCSSIIAQLQVINTHMCFVLMVCELWCASLHVYCYTTNKWL